MVDMKTIQFFPRYVVEEGYAVYIDRFKYVNEHGCYGDFYHVASTFLLIAKTSFPVGQNEGPIIFPERVFEGEKINLVW